MASNALECLGPIEPNSYNQETADIICERIASGETLSAICQDPDMPNRVTVWRWLKFASFAQQYAHAREAQGDYEFDEIRHLSDEVSDDPAALQKAKLQIDTRKWRAERLNRQSYGQKTQHEHAHTLHPTYGEERLPTGVDWLAGRLEGNQHDAEPVDSPVGEG